MQPVNTHGAVKIPMNSQESDYRMKLAAAKAQADGNPYVSGVSSATPEEMTKNSRSEYGAPTTMPQEYTQKNFAQKDSVANTDVEDPTTTTGSVELGTSATKTPEADPSSFQTEGLERRLAMIANAVSNADDSNNNRAQTGRLA